MLRLPGVIEAGQRIQEPVELTDLSPTILSLLGVDVPTPDFDGRDLSPALRGRAALDPDHPVVVYRRNFERGRVDGIDVEGEQLGIRVGDWKLIQHSVGDGHELYDLEKDPGEARNLYGEQPDARASLEAELENWRQRHREDHAPIEISPDVKRALEALGYTD